MGPAAAPERFWSEKRAGTVLIVGLSERTGLPAAKLLDAQGVPYKISDCAPHAELAPRLAQIGAAQSDVFSGPQDSTQLDGITEVLIAPGVPRTIPLLREACRRGIPVQVDIDFLYDLMGNKRIVAITGTDGKTTTTTLVGELLGKLGSVVVAGNIGLSVLAAYDSILAADWIVLEVSSFMLEQLARFRPNYAAILNIAQDHIDRYDSLSAYTAVKLGLVMHCQSSDVLVLNADDPRLAGFSPPSAKLRTFSKTRSSADSFFCDDTFHVAGGRFDYRRCLLRGVGNIDNILAAATLAHEAGVALDDIVHVVQAFGGIPHRLEHLGSFRGVDVYEDSKASNVHAVDTALRSFSNNVVLILGGRDKGLDFTVLRRHRQRIKRLICYGEHGERIRAALDLPGALYQYRFADAVALAVQQCAPGDVLLLSPGCTSWDQFENYEVRGDTFRRLVPRCFTQHRRSV